MNWGKWIVVSFVLFAAFIAVIVTISMRQDVNLVSTQYYHDDLVYQQQLQRKNNTEALAEKPVIAISDSRLSVIFPDNHQVQQGTITLFRPSSDKLDQNFTLSPSSDSVRIFALQPLEPGAYRVKMTWTAEGKEFYIEKFIVI
jgi:hypothetical protein